MVIWKGQLFVVRQVDQPEKPGWCRLTPIDWHGYYVSGKGRYSETDRPRWVKISTLRRDRVLSVGRLHIRDKPPLAQVS